MVSVFLYVTSVMQHRLFNMLGPQMAISETVWACLLLLEKYLYLLYERRTKKKSWGRDEQCWNSRGQQGSDESCSVWICDSFVYNRLKRETEHSAVIEQRNDPNSRAMRTFSVFHIILPSPCLKLPLCCCSGSSCGFWSQQVMSSEIKLYYQLIKAHPMILVPSWWYWYSSFEHQIWHEAPKLFLVQLLGSLTSL